MLKSVFVSLALLGVCSEAYAKDPRFHRIEMTVDQVVIHFNKKASEGKTSLVPIGSNRPIKPKYFDKRRVVFSMDGTDGSECFRVKIKSKYWSPVDKSSSESWCFKNVKRENLSNKHKEIAETKAQIANINLNLSSKNASYDDDISATANFSEECRYPKPIVTPKPASFCSNPEKLTARRNQCYAPILKATCSYSVYELADMDDNDAERLGVSLACLQAANTLVNKEATVGDVLTASSQSVLMSKSGIRGFFGNLISFGLAAARHDNCVAHLNSQCHPKPPSPPDCSEWKQYEKSLSASSTQITNLKLNRSRLENKVRELEGEAQLMKKGAYIRNFKTSSS